MGGDRVINNDDKWFWVLYLNDDKDTVACCGNKWDICNYLGIKPNSLWKYFNRTGRVYKPKYLIFKYLTSDLDKEDDL